mgnify:CR=1 FL=1
MARKKEKKNKKKKDEEKSEEEEEEENSEEEEEEESEEEESEEEGGPVSSRLFYQDPNMNPLCPVYHVAVSSADGQGVYKVTAFSFPYP